jgi:putative radical SAM enzyme (TIGR03279 family)
MEHEMHDTGQKVYSGLVKAVEPKSLAATLGVQPDDILLKVNGEHVEDVIDVQYYAAEYDVELTIQRGNEIMTLAGRRKDMQPLGMEFEHPTFDIDIRRCNNLCEFCFVLQMSPRFRRTLYIKDDDYRYSFLFGHFVTLTNLSDHDEWRIVEQHLSPLYVSVHVTDHEARRKYLRNADAPDIIEQLKWLTGEGIEVHTQIVVTPEVNDGALFERSVRELADLYPGVQTISVVPIGLTRHHKYQMRVHTVEEANLVLDQCETWQAEFRTTFGINFVYPTDEWYLVTGRPIPPIDAYDGYDLTENGLGQVRRFLDDWIAVKSEIRETPLIKRLTLCSGALFAPTLTDNAREFSALSGVQTEVIPITNTRLGESITVAGLVMGNDVIEQLKDRDLGDVVVLPRVMFDHPDGISLDDISPMAVAKALNKPVALVDMMGDLVDIIYGRPALFFRPTGERIITLESIKKDGGWAVEKYL